MANSYSYRPGLNWLVLGRSIPDIRALMSHRGMPATPSYMMLRLVRRKGNRDILGNAAARGLLTPLSIATL